MSPLHLVLSREEASDKLLEIVREQLRLPGTPITDATTWDQLGADSVDLVEILIAADEVFAIDLPDDSEPATFGELVNLVLRHVGRPR